MANCILKVHLWSGADGSIRTHIERVLWAYEFTIDTTNDEAREDVARRIVNGQVFYSVGKDGRRADVETFELHGKLYNQDRRRSVEAGQPPVARQILVRRRGWHARCAAQ